MIDLTLVTTAVKQETHDTKTFYLEPDNKSAIEYKAGQFLTLIFHHRGNEIRRSYSLGSTPGIDNELFITVKRKINGEISRQLFDHYKPGDIIASLMPAGRFIIEEPFASVYFFITAGSGITPIFSLVKELLYKHPETKVILINQCRNERDVIYKHQLKELELKFAARFYVIQFFSRPHSRKHKAQRLNNELLEKIIHQTPELQFQTANFYLCGPIAFMRMAQFTLKTIGFNDEQIHKEQFVIDLPPPVPFLSDTAPKSAVIYFQQKKYSLTVAYPQTILDAALQNNIELPYSCKAGRCSTCAALCIKGKVKMSINEVLTERDIEKGLVLTCVGYAETDMELSF